MNLKRFAAPSVEAALARVRREMGPDAVILSTREIPAPGVAGRFEVLAAADSRSARPRSPVPGSTRPRGAAAGDAPVILDTARSRPVSKPARSAAGDLLDLLIGQEVDPRLAEALVRRVEHSASPRAALESLLERIIRVEEAGPASVTALVGSTGVGKTTTLAKLAARAAGEKPVALVTCDTWRVAAVEQLAVFADGLDIPFAAAYTPEELLAFVLEFTAGGVAVFIDTPGKSPRDPGGIRTVHDFLSPLPGCVRHLVVPATLRTGDVAKLLVSFQPVGADRLILSKLDETSTYGPLLTLLARSRWPVSFVTFGPGVPGDLAGARGPELARLMLSGESHDRPVEKRA